MQYTSLDLTVMMNETVDRIHKLNDEIEKFENGLTARYDDLYERYETEPDENKADGLWTELENITWTHNNLIEARNSSRKLYDLLESAQAELEYIELTERNLNK